MFLLLLTDHETSVCYGNSGTVAIADSLTLSKAGLQSLPVTRIAIKVARCGDHTTFSSSHKNHFGAKLIGFAFGNTEGVESGLIK